MDAITRLNRAHALAKDGKFDEAIKQYQSSIKDLPIASAHFGLAKALRAMGKFDEARVEYRVVLEMLSKEVGADVLLRPESPDGVRFSIAGVYQSLAGLERDAGDREAERSVWESVIDLLEKKPDPDNSVYWGVIGQGLYRVDRVGDSRQAMEKTIALRGETKPTIRGGPRWWYLTMALAKSGGTENAREMYDILVAQLGASASESQKRLREEAAEVLGLASEVVVEVE